MSKKITLENVDSSELPEVPVIGEVKQIRFTQDMELVSTLADSDLFMIQAGADLEARPNTITFDLIIKNLSGPIEEGSKKFVTGDMMFKVIGDMNLLDTWDNTNLVNSLNATYVNVRRIEEELRREINRSTGKDEQHDEQIANLRQDLTSTNEMLNQEINRSVAKDNEHDELLEGLRDDVDSTSSKLDAEINRSTTKDAEHDTLLKGLRVDVNANKSAIDSEVARSTARDEAHDAAISKNASDIATETSRAKAEEAKIRQEMQAADTNLQNAITAETERATGVEEDLQRQITDLSGSTDDRLEALEALSHEQNTDTGTTSKTFVIDSGNTGAMLKAEGGGLSTRTKGDAGYANFTVQNLVIKGDVTQEGDTFITQAERVEVRDNMILINEGETGAGVTAGFAGIEVDRGTEQNFMFGFNESDGMFKIGKEGNMFDVALRQPVGDMIDGMFASWDAATKTFKTTNVIPYNKSLDFKFDPEIVDATLKMKFMEAGLGLSMSGDDSILALLPGMPQDEVKYSLISTNTNGIILGDSSGSNDKFILDIKKPSFISPVLDKNVIIGGKNAYFSYYSHIMGSPNTIIASCGVTAPSFYRASDNAEVLYSLDQARLTDGMFLSWDATNKMLVANNLVPEGIKLYFGTSSNYIDYYNEDNGYIRFITNTGILRFSTNNNFTIFRSSSNNGFQFIGKIETTYGVLNSLSDNLTIGTKQGNGSIKLYIGESSYITTPFSAVTFKRSSDDSEVLYQADLKSVLTGKETNYAPTVKAVSDAIDAVNTGTTESLKNYLKLSGGTMTGSIIMNNSIVLKSKDNNGVERRLIGKSIEGTTHIGDIDGKAQIYTSDTDVIHFRSTGSYKILDSYNLPDPATKSGNNAFTGTNSFVANKFSVGNFRVDSNSDFGVNTPYREGLERLSGSLYFKYNNLEDTKVSFGSVSSSTVANYAYIGIGSVGYNNAQYKFCTDSLELNTIFRIDFGNASAISANESTIIFGSNRRDCYLRSNDTNLVHVKNSNSYKIWDASNLPTPASTSDIPDVSDMAKKSEANTFTAQNTFTAGQFNVGPFEVSSTGQLLVNITTSGGWERSITFKANSDNATSIRIGGHGIGSTSNFAWIGVGDVEYDTAQYRFYGTSMKVPSVWSLDDADGNSLIWTQSTQLAHIGRATGTTKIRSGAVDLIHTKGATDYKILDESNYSQYLPTNNKWTYGFVVTYIEGSNADFNTLFAGPDSPKIVFNYYRPIGHNTNAPTGMSYGAVLQIDGNYNSGYNNVVLRPQLAFDINHNVENGTRYMWFRTANNLGYGDSSNWKRVVTADENVAVLVMDANTYPSIARIDGTTYNWLRTPAQGLLPNTQATLDSGGTSYLGTNDWSFGYASIHTIYSKRYMFGNTGVDFRLGTNNKIAATISGSARGIEIGDLLVSSNYGDNAAKVPTNGIFSSGIIKSYSGFSSDSRINNLNIRKTSNDVLHISSFAGENVINKPGVDPVSGQSVGDGVALTYFWGGDYAFQLVGDIDGTGMAYRKYTPSTGNSTDWKFLADTKWVNTKLGGYLPLTGGILSGQLIINSISNSLILNNTNSSETESFIKVQLNGTSKAAIGFLSSIGSYIYNYESKKYLFVGTDGAYLGNTISKAKLLTSADLSGYATQTWANSKFAPLSTFKILSGYPAIVNTGNEWILTSNQSGIYINYRTPSDTIIPTTWYWKNGTSTGYANGYWGNLYMVEKLVATQEWVSGRGYLTGITKSMVTTALGYTPPTTNTTYSQATSSTLGLVKVGATGLASKNYAVQLNSSGQMYVAVPWTDTNSTYSAATSSTYGLVKIGATGLASKNYAVQLNSSGQMYVSVPWTDTDTNTHYTTKLYAGASGTAANSAISNPYLKVTDDNAYRNQVRFIGAGATSISSDASGNITITSTNTTYGLASSSSNGLMSSSQCTKLSKCIETVSAANMVTSVQVVDTIPGESSQVTGRLYLKFA
nr:MAG TPA: chromosome segregation protein [Crassvirales sp.]